MISLASKLANWVLNPAHTPITPNFPYGSNYEIVEYYVQK
jgi:hypothetical protein